MSDCRVLRKYSSLCLALVVVGMICRPCGAQEPNKLPLDDPNAVMQVVLSAVKAIEQPTTGRGIAIVKTENYRESMDGKEFMVHFVFKDQKSREDYFEHDGEHRGPRVCAVAKSDKGYITARSAVDIRPSESYRREIGRDFHPDTFLKFFGAQSLAEWLKYQLEHKFDYPGTKTDRSVELDDDGVLHVSVRTYATTGTKHGREEIARAVKISFDTQKGYRPVYYERKVTRADGSWYTRQAKLQWARFGSAWYVSAFECNLLPSNRDHIIGTIKDFSPDVTVSDAEFTLEGMGILDRTFVHDRVAGKDYWYKSPKLFLADPEIPPKEADLVQRIREQQSAAASRAKVDDPNHATTNAFYLRIYQTGRLIGPLSLKPGSLLPPLDKETYIVANPTESELEIRKCLRESFGYESKYFDCTVVEVIEIIRKMVKHRLGDKAPDVRIEDVDALITMEITGKEAAYDVLFNIAAQAKARVFIEDGAVVLSRKKLREIAALEVTTNDMVARRELPSP
ncbi:MAG: hypothetical protein ISS70_02355 [Phycisphaerae bacterium]|nr:hypothetical protein [Phycisphaerae bacterium]